MAERWPLPPLACHVFIHVMWLYDKIFIMSKVSHYLTKNEVPHYHVKSISFDGHLIAMSMFVLWLRIGLGYGHPMDTLTFMCSLE